jgi:hypothetical protein
MASIVFTAGLDDTAFVRGITNMERTAQRSVDPVNKAFGRWGEGIERSTAGLRRAQSAISGVAGIASGALGTIGLIGGALGGTYLIVERIANASEQAAKAAERELRAREKVRAELDSNLASLRTELGERSRLEASIASIADDAESQRKRLREEGEFVKLTERRLDLLRQVQALTAPRTEGRSEQFGFADLDTKRELLAQARALQEEISSQFDPRFAEITRIEQARRAAAEQNGVRDGLREQIRLEAEGARLRGDDLESRRLLEGAEHQERLRKIAELESAGATNGEELRTIETDLHRLRLANIEEERDRRSAAEAERARAEEARIDREMRRRELDEKAIDIEILRAKGMKDEAEQARVRLDIERKLQQLRADDGAEQSDRVRIERKLRELERLQLAGIGGEGIGASRFGGSGISTSGATLTGAERQIFGTSDSATQRQLQRMEQLNNIAESIKQLFGSVTQSGSVKVAGDFTARLI